MMTSVKTSLIMEGGAMRGLFTCGVIDVFLENGIEFNAAAGISAGAVFGSNFKSKQNGRPLRYNLTFCDDPRYGSFRSLIKTGDLFEEELCYKLIPNELDVFDEKTYRENPMKFIVGATDIETGRCVYHNCVNGDAEDMKWFQASASMPIVSRPVKVAGMKLLDGGIADSVPYAHMMRRGYDRNVIVLTREKGYRKKKSPILPLFDVALKGYPEVKETMANRHIVYNRQMDEIDEMEKDGKVLVIRPSIPPAIGRLEKNRDELRRVYDMGRIEAEFSLEAVKEFLKR